MVMKAADYFPRVSDPIVCLPLPFFIYFNVFTATSYFLVVYEFNYAE